MLGFSLSYPLVPGEIEMRLDLVKSGPPEDIAYLGALITAVFEQQPTLAAEVVRRLLGDGLYRIQSVGAGLQRGCRLPGEISPREMWVPGCHIRRIADDHIESVAARQWLVPVALDKFNI